MFAYALHMFSCQYTWEGLEQVMQLVGLHTLNLLNLSQIEFEINQQLNCSYMTMQMNISFN